VDSKDNDVLPVVVSIAENSFISSGSSENNGYVGDNYDDDKKKVLNDGIAAMNSKATDDGESFLFNDMMVMRMRMMMMIEMMMMIMMMIIIMGNADYDDSDEHEDDDNDGDDYTLCHAF